MKLLLLLALSPLWAEQPEQAFPLPLFKDGLHTRYSANAIPDGALSEALNVLIDQDVDGVVVARKGYSKYNVTALPNAQSVRGLWPFDAPDGTKYMVAFSSGSFYKFTGDGVWTAIPGLSGYSSTKEFDCTQTIGKLFCGNGDVVFSWNGTSTAAVSGAPLGNLVGKFRNRFLLAGISGSKARVRGSGELDETDWTLKIPGVSTTPFSIAFGGVDDGQDVTCLMGAYQDVFIVGKRQSLWGLYGFGRTDFQVRELSREIGCLEQRSVQEKNGCLYWLSLRGMEKFCGSSIERIGDPIRDNIDTIIATAGNARSSMDTQQTDFESGNLTASGAGAPISSTISPGNITPSTATITWNSSNLGNGTLVNTSAFYGDIRLPISTGTVLGGDFSSSYYWTCATTNASASQNSCSSSISDAAALISPSAAGTVGRLCIFSATEPTYTIKLLDGDSAVLNTYAPDATLALVLANSGFSTGTISIANITSTGTVKIVFSITGTSRDGLPAAASLTETNTTGAGFTLSYTISATHNACNGCDGVDTEVASCWVYNISNVKVSSYAPSGTYTSTTFDTGVSTPVFSLFSSNFSSSTAATLTFTTQGSTDNATYSTISTSPVNVQVSSQKRYLNFKGALATTIGNQSPIITSVGPLQSSTTGYFIGQCRNPGTGITSWGNFLCNLYLPDNGSVSFALSTGTSCNQVTRATATWTAQTNNTPISLSTAAYVAYRPLFTVDSGSQTPRLQDCTINWTEGATRPPVASSIYRDRYYLSYTSSTASGAVSDHILVLDKNDKWTLFNQHNCYSLTLYERHLYCGSSTAAGQVWTLDSGTDDDGAIITSRIRTKAFNLGIPDRRKRFNRLYLDLEPSPDPVQTITLTGRYTLERSTPTYSLGTIDLNEDPGTIMTSKVPFPLSNPVTGRYIQLELESSGLNSPWRLFSGRLYSNALDPE